MTARRAAVPLRECAQWYAGRMGWDVFPCAPRGKTPAIAGGRGVLDATTDPDQIRDWWQRTPTANIGIACGAPSGVWVLDIDTDKGGATSLAELERDHGPLPHVPTVRTGSGGLHLYWTQTPGLELRNRVGIWPGVDARTGGGYVVAPPSIHPCGASYVWLRRPGATRLDVAPRWLVEAVQGPPTPAREAIAPTGPRASPERVIERARKYVATMDPSISGQGGHNALWAATIALVCGFDLPEADALAILASDFSPRCHPPWSASALRHKVTQALSARLSRGYLL